MKLVLRLLPPVDTHAHISLGSKFGAAKKECERIIRVCGKLKMQNDIKDRFDLIGFSFHVGTGCKSAKAYKACIEECSRLCLLAQH